MKVITYQNKFEVLSIPDDQVTSVLKEVEVPQPALQRAKGQVTTVFEEGEVSHSSLQEERPSFAIGTPAEGSSPTYAEMEKKRKLRKILVHLMKIPLRNSPKKVINLKRPFKKKKPKISICKEVKQL